MELDQVLIVGIVFLAVYKIIEIFVHRKERINLVDKLDFTKENNADFSKILGTTNINSDWAIKIGCLLVGVGIGVLVAYAIISACGLYCQSAKETMRNVYEQISVIYTSSAFLFGGAGLLAAYFIEKKNRIK